MTADEGSAFDIRIRSVRLVHRVADGAPFIPNGLLPVLGLAALLVFGLTAFANGVESAASRTARQALDDAGAGWARVKMSGQWAQLYGTPPSQAAAVQAVEAVHRGKANTLSAVMWPVTKVSSAFAEPSAAVASPSSAAASAAEKTANMCERAYADLVGAKNIEFALGSAEIPDGDSPFLDSIVRVANNCPGVLAIQGYTDSTGSDVRNEELSLARAQAVRQALIGRGLPADRLLAEGHGDHDPVASNRTDTGRDRNRRIEILVQEPEN